MTTYGNSWQSIAKQWDAMQINPVKAAAFRGVAARLIKSKARYQEVEKLTGVPWFMIAAIHERESSQNWNTQLAQGDPLHAVSTHVPRGAGPFENWVMGAVWALDHEGFTHIQDWRIEKILYYLEVYNGEGYHNRGLPSPYVFAGTNQYVRGKFTSDGHFSATAVDEQLGTAGLILTMSHYDDSIKFVRETPVGVEPIVVAKKLEVTAPVKPVSVPTVPPQPTRISLFDRLLQIFGG